MYIVYLITLSWETDMGSDTDIIKLKFIPHIITAIAMLFLIKGHLLMWGSSFNIIPGYIIDGYPIFTRGYSICTC